MSTHAPTPGSAPTPHISNRTYLIVFAWLAVMTVLEVGITQLGLVEAVQIFLLIAVAVIKAALVVLFYMHLRYDSKWYWVTLLVPIFFVLLVGRFLFLR